MKNISMYVFFLFTGTLFSQNNFQGKATYQSKTTVAMDFEGREMSEEQKKMIQQRMKGMFEKSYVLTFDKASATYKEEEKLATPGQGGRGGFMMMSGFTGGLQYKNTKDGVLLEAKEFFGKKFLIKEDLKKPDWVLGTETKQIGNYLCFKATMIKKVDDFDFKSMRPKKQKGKKNGKQGKKKGAGKQSKSSNMISISDEIEMPKEIEVTAWYTPQIPVSNGPGSYWGLPGLILEINEGKTTILCSEITLNPTDKATIKAPTKGKEVSRKKYNTIVKKKREEMRERFQNRRGGKGRGHF